MKIISLAILLSCLAAAGNTQTDKPGTGKSKPVKNIVLFIGDGMGIAQVSAGLTVNGGHLNLLEMKEIGFSKTQAAFDYITDSGAGGTAIATGYKTYAQAIGLDKDTIPRKSILAYAGDYEKASGIVVTSQVTHATPASFVAHQKDRYMYEAIASDFLNSGPDVFIGGGRKYFEDRKDSRNLSQELALKGYQVIYQLRDLEKVKTGKVAGLLYEDKPPRASDGRGNMLSVSVAKALELLNQDEDGFFLMVEGSQIDWGGHDNDTDYILEELIDFDDAIGTALDFARKDGNTLVIVTADHETGGMSLTGGDTETGHVQAAYTTSGHTGVMVPVFSYGPGAENFKGIYENTELFRKMMNVFGFVAPDEVN